MYEYKIENPFALDKNGVIKPQFNNATYNQLLDDEWLCVEMVDGHHVVLSGVNDSFDEVQCVDDETKSLLHKVFDNISPKDIAASQRVSIHISVYNNTRHQGRKAVDTLELVVTDIIIGDNHLHYHDSVDICSRLGIPHVPLYGYKRLIEAVESVSYGVRSIISPDKRSQARGLVLMSYMSPVLVGLMTSWFNEYTKHHGNFTFDSFIKKLRSNANKQ